MKITVFTKQGKKKDGTPFKKYVTTLTRKSTGEKVYADVRFPEDSLNAYQMKTGVVISFPAIIEFKGNMTESHTTAEDGKEYTNHFVWVKEIVSDEPYVDTSLDDFE